MANTQEIIDMFVKYTGNGYRETKSGKYETFICSQQKDICLGTYNTAEEAACAVINFKLNRLLQNLERFHLDLADGKVVYHKYIAFPSGDIVNHCGILVKGMVDSSGYSEVLLNGHLYRRHRVIAEAFLEQVDGKTYVNHINGVKTDNRIENLEWVTRSENTLHAYNTGLERKVTGCDHWRHIFSPDMIIDIRTNCIPRKKGYGVCDFARKYHCHTSTISDVLKGLSYNDV